MLSTNVVISLLRVEVGGGEGGHGARVVLRRCELVGRGGSEDACYIVASFILCVYVCMCVCGVICKKYRRSLSHVIFNS